MKKIFERLRPFIRWVVQHAGLVVILAFMLSAVSLYFARNLRVDTDLANLIPSSYPSVQALERLRETVGSESDVAVVIESPSFEANKTFAEALIPRALALEDPESGEPYLMRVEYKRDTEFLQNNALYFATPDELDSLEQYLVEKIEEAKLEANPFYFDLDEEDEEETDSTAAAFADTYEQIVGKEYPISKDSTGMVLRFYPSGSQTDIGFIDRLYGDLDNLVAEMNPQSVHPEMQITLAGRLLRQLVEVRAITNDIFGSFGVGVSVVLLTVVLYFLYKGYHARSGGRFNPRALLFEIKRAPVMAALIGIPLLMSLSWTYGVAYLSFETLNLMTSTLGLVLFGLGIDYGIHFYARYTEERGLGRNVIEAAEVTFSSTGQAIFAGSLTTATALYVLMIADFRGFSEFGLIGGTGILFALISMLVVMPSLIALFERVGLLKLQPAVPTNGRKKGARRYPAARIVVIGSVAAVLIALVLIPRVSFEYQFGKLEPEYTDYEMRHAKVREVLGREGGRNPAYIVLDDPEEVPAVVAAIKEYAARDTLTPTIGSIESLQDRFPVRQEDQQAKLARIASIREILSDPLLELESSEELDVIRRAAQTTAPISLDDVPEFLRKRFTSKSGEIGNFVMVYPSVGLSDGRQSIAFSEDVGKIVTEDGKVYHAGSTSLVAADMLKLMMAEAPWMVLVTFVIVVLVMYLNFRSIRWAMLALVPLLVGVLWMLLLMEILGLKFNFYNLVVLPTVLGIGNDAGVHLVHRYREEGRGSIMHVLRATGEHVAMGSITTIIGFGGLLLSFHPGLRSIGELAAVGVGMTLLAALLFLTALIQWIEDRTVRTEKKDSSFTGSAESTESAATSVKQ